MSKIHEALKRAAEERISKAGSGSISGLVELSGQERLAGIEPTPDAARLASVQRKRSDAGKVGLEEFVKRCVPSNWKFEPAASVFSAHLSHEVGAEKFRTLRSRLYQIAAAQPLKKILVTSSIPAEGKTFVAANLAQSFIRQSGRRVLLIDSDLRASRLHLHLGAKAKPGLSDYLSGECDEFQVTQAGNNGNLCLIPGGREVSNPSELLHSDRMKQLLEQMASHFDWVILDSPPALAVHDASILADMCDGVLFIVRAGSTDFELAEKATAEFQEKNLVGVVLNRVERSDAYGDYYYSGYGTSKNRETEPES